MERRELEHAIAEIDILLDSEGSTEADYQAWFERHPVVFVAYGYRRHLVHPRIAVDDKEYIPDFVVQQLDGLWEILELKTPETLVLKDRERRQSFYSAFEEYLAQCRDYSKALEQKPVRENFNQRYAADVQDSIASVVVAGRRPDLDLHQVFRILFDRGLKVRLQTYDRLEFHRAQLYAQNENHPGLSIHAILIPGKVSGRDNYLLDMGVESSRNRVSIYVNTLDEVCFRIVDAGGNSSLMRVPMHRAAVLYGAPVYLSFELGVALQYSYAAIEVNGQYFEDRRLDQMTLDASALQYHVMGSDVYGQEHTDFSLLELVGFNRTLRFDEKQELRGYFATRYEASFKDPALLPGRVIFLGHQFLHSSDHPNFAETKAAQQGVAADGPSSRS
jgi:hypothetical protein